MQQDFLISAQERRRTIAAFGRAGWASKPWGVQLGFFDFNKEHLRLKDVESIQLEFPGECAGKSQKVVSRFESGTPNSSGFLSFSLLSWPCCDCGFVQAQIRIDQHI